MQDTEEFSGGCHCERDGKSGLWIVKDSSLRPE
jgi:hypothetical protein